MWGKGNQLLHRIQKRYKAKNALQVGWGLAVLLFEIKKSETLMLP